MNRFESTLLKKKIVGPRTVLLQFEDVFGSWVPGQFVMLEVLLPHEEQVTRRAYSIANACGSGVLELLIEQKDDLAKMGTFVLNVPEGSKILLEGPYGNFKLREGDERVVLIASGTGLAPLRAMLQECVRTNREAVLLFSSKTNEQVYLKEELLEYAKEHEFIQVELFVTREDTEYNKGRITKDALLEKLRSVENSRFYLCGAPEFVKAIQDALRELGTPLDKLHREQW